MMQAMMTAELGDDVLGDDPTVRTLEERAAEVLGKERALYVPSGTQGNAIAVRCWTSEGEEVIVEERAHIYNYESAHLAVISGVMPRPLASERGEIPLDALREALAKRKNVHVPNPALIALENTHNFWSGKVLSLDYMNEVCALARQFGVPVHLDGARIWNAAAATGVPEAEYAATAGTVMACFSKGLGAPVGSILAGPAKQIERARAVRKLLGGGMRQVGIIAAAALHGLEHHRERLVEDHRRARRIAEALADLPALQVDLAATASPLRARLRPGCNTCGTTVSCAWAWDRRWCAS
jgi:threonine aldolase